MTRPVQFPATTPSRPLQLSHGLLRKTENVVEQIKGSKLIANSQSGPVTLTSVMLPNQLFAASEKDRVSPVLAGSN
jgi:hypothetical protein